MKRFCALFLYLNICTCLFSSLQSQEIRLSITAEKEISKSLIDSIQTQKIFTDYLSLERESKEIPNRLQKLGFIESELKSLVRQNDSLYSANYFFGKRIAHIKIYYPKEDFDKKELSFISDQIEEEYFIIPFETIEPALQKLNSLKTDDGNAFAKIRLQNLNLDQEDKLSAYLVLDLGKKRTIDSIAIKGYKKFPISYLRYFAGIKKGETFSQKKLLTQNEVINSLPFASTIKPPEALFRKDTTVVYLYLKKQNANIFDGVLGFTTDEETNKLQLNGYLNLELNNNLNFGEQLLIKYKADGDEQRDFKVKINLPYLLRTPVGISSELQIFKRDSTFITTDQQVRINYQIDPSSTAYLGYKGYESSNLLDTQIVGTPVEDFTSSFFLLGGRYTKLQNNPLFPIKSEITIESEIGSREFKSSSDDQIKLEASIHYIFNLNYKNSIFIRNNTASLFSDNYLTNELFRFGGIESIRGFDENSIDASLYSILNTEYRYQFNAGLYLHSIIDIGYFENESLNLKEKLYSYGIGLGLQTKPGLLRLNIANGNIENQAFDFSNTKLHLILSTRF